LLAKPKRAFLDGFELQTFHNSRDEDTTTRQPRKGLVQTLHMSGLWRKRIMILNKLQQQLPWPWYKIIKFNSLWAKNINPKKVTYLWSHWENSPIMLRR
jgi:hypothetical protein